MTTELSRKPRPTRTHQPVRDGTTFTSKVITFFGIFGPVLLLIASAWFGWPMNFRLIDLVLVVVMYYATILGITVGYHRLFVHKSWKCGPVTRAFWAILGSMAMQATVQQWASDHVVHHRHADKEGDPHSPNHHGGGVMGVLRGIGHVHFWWLFTKKGRYDPYKVVPWLANDPVIRWVDRLYVLWVLLAAGIPFGIGYLYGGVESGLQAMVWGFGIRYFMTQHATWSVNSWCHLWGRRPFDTDDQSRNSWVVALLTGGEGFHNNHHAFQGSARQGLSRIEKPLDVSYWVIRAMELLGLAWDVKQPTRERIKKWGGKAAPQE